MYIAKRMLTMLITIWIVVTLTFLIMHMIPGDPFASDSNTLPEAVVENMRARYHLDQPLPVQYVMYLKNLLTFDLGPSIQSKTTDVNTLISRGFPPSAWIGLQAIMFAILAGVTLGSVAALYHNRALDYLSMIVAIIGISIPSFILAPLLIKYAAVQWRLLPVASWGSWKHTVLPSLALSVTPLAIIARFVRTSLIDVLRQDYIHTAKAKGLSTWEVVVKHGLRNALIPVLSFMGPLFASVITGTFVIEKIFAIPGIGKYFVDSIFNRDYPVILGTTIFYSTVLVVTLFLIDILYRVVDPRIQLVSKGE